MIVLGCQQWEKTWKSRMNMVRVWSPELLTLAKWSTKNSRVFCQPKKHFSKGIIIKIWIPWVSDSQSVAEIYWIPHTNGWAPFGRLRAYGPQGSARMMSALAFLFPQHLCFGSPFLRPCECHSRILQRRLSPAASATRMGCCYPPFDNLKLFSPCFDNLKLFSMLH